MVVSVNFGPEPAIFSVKIGISANNSGDFGVQFEPLLLLLLLLSWVSWMGGDLGCHIGQLRAYGTNVHKVAHKCINLHIIA